MEEEVLILRVDRLECRGRVVYDEVGGGGVCGEEGEKRGRNQKLEKC